MEWPAVGLEAVCVSGIQGEESAAILERGMIVHEGTSAALKGDPKVLEEYLGVGKTKAGALAPKTG